MQEILDVKKKTEELNAISSLEERKERKADLEKAAREEIDYLAKKLTELVPQKDSIEFESMTDVEMFSLKPRKERKYKRVSSHEILMFDVEKSLPKGKDDARSSTEAPAPTEEALEDDFGSEEEFLQRYKKQKEGTDDDSDDTNIVLA